MTKLNWFESKRLPKKIKILGIYYSVKQNPVPISADSKNDGEISRYRGRIWVDGARNTVDRWVIFTHEIIHALSDLMVIGLTENQVEALANGIHCIYEENSLLIEQDEQ